MMSKPKPKPDDPEQSKRFIETAKEVGADEDSEALERAFKKITSTARTPDQRHRKSTKTNDSQSDH